MVGVLPRGVGEVPVLLGASETATDGLISVDVLDAVLVSVVFDGDVDGGNGDGFAGDPAHALESEELVTVIAHGFVL